MLTRTTKIVSRYSDSFNLSLYNSSPFQHPQVAAAANSLDSTLTPLAPQQKLRNICIHNFSFSKQTKIG